MLTLLLTATVLFALGAAAVAFGSVRALRRLGIDPMRAAQWLGLAEPAPEPAPRRGAS